MATPSSRLLRLPPELILEISDLLPFDGILSMKLTHSTLNNTLPTLPRLKNRSLSNCARYAIERYRISQDQQPSHLRCILCKAVYPANIFNSSSSPACLPLSFAEGVPRPEVVELPQYYCAWHVGRLVRVIRTEACGRNEWVSDIKRICMHEGCISGWKDCKCDCDSCGYKMVRTYTRYLNNKTECKQFAFWRNIAAGESEDPQEKAKGRLYVRETCWDVDAPHKKWVVDLPVHYQHQARSDIEASRDPSVCGHPPQSNMGRFGFDKYTTTGEFLCSRQS